MAEDKPRLARLTAILTQLQSKSVVTAREMADKHQVSIRTIYRDIRTLNQSGVPIMTEEGKGYALMQGYQLPPITFSQEEANAVVTVAQLIEKNNDHSLVAHYNNAVMKIKAVMKHTQKEGLDLLASRIQIRHRAKDERASHYLIQLQSTITNYQLVKIDYLSLKNQRSQREIEPFALYTTNDHWVLIAFCRLKRDFRAFRLDCIQDLQLTEVHFEPHSMTLAQYLEECRKKW